MQVYSFGTKINTHKMFAPELHAAEVLYTDSLKSACIAMAMPHKLHFAKKCIVYEKPFSCPIKQMFYHCI